ncbi:tRNA-splicing ligase [Phaeosphaeria sp. MPI-PUGE-AT-0046c]|nr:tRNA-splicing ligase [Phaeosphaeria sp. MPI-PUGE-AT-0046c]
MPATRLTIACNAKQSTKAPVLIPVSAAHNPVASTSVCALVLKTAQSKLRVKKPTRIFVAGTGKELLSEEDWKNSIKDDVVLLISAGEDFVGVKRESGVNPHANPKCPVELLTSNTPVEQLAITQLETTARTLPGIVHAVGQPDLHAGTRFPIGAVVASEGWIHPPLIGSDIGCGMAWYKTRLSRTQVDGNRGKKIAEKLRGLEGPWRTQADREAWLQEKDSTWSAGEEWDKALGTIGAGNHFAEIQVVEEAATEIEQLGLCVDDVILLVHSGSRGYGGSILKKFTSGSHVSFEADSTEAVEYMREHDKACQWAKANRDLIALRFLSCLEPGNEAWELGSAHVEDTDVDAATITLARTTLQARKLVDIWHNNVQKVAWPPSPPPSANEAATAPASLAEATRKVSLGDAGSTTQQYLWVHRKGAAPTYDPNTGNPLNLLPLPGSRGTPTLILKPSFSTSTGWGVKNGLSLAHGAGRAMSRTKALASLASKYKGQNILEPRAGRSNGTWVICDEKDLVWEEAPDAYKDVELVGQDLVDAGVAEIVGRCQARVSYKVRKEVR